MKSIWNDQETYQLVQNRFDYKLSCPSVDRAIKKCVVNVKLERLMKYLFKLHLLWWMIGRFCILLSVTLKKAGKALNYLKSYCNRMEKEDWDRLLIFFVYILVKYCFYMKKSRTPRKNLASRIIFHLLHWSRCHVWWPLHKWKIWGIWKVFSSTHFRQLSSKTHST